MSWATTPLSEVIVKRSGTVDPSKHPDEFFDLYSIPAYDRGDPDVVTGREIGSSKQIVQPGDVLLSRIVPHIRRAWIVGADNGRRLIASGEWIVFRSGKCDPRWLRHLLLSDRFHREFMATVAGVGGSLLRARPAQVAQITIPLPPLYEQRRIAAILDQADAVRAKRSETLCRLGDLAEAIFLDFFNDDASEAVPFDSIVTGTRNGLSPAKAGTVVSDVLTLSAVTQGAFDPTAVKSSTFLSEPPVGMRVSGDDFLICRGNGNLNLVGAGVSPGRDYPDLTFPDTVIAASLDQEKVDPVFLEMAWRRPAIRTQVEAAARTTNGTYKINQQSLGAIKIVIPPLAQQQEFARLIRAIPHPDTSDFDALFTSLQSRAFSGHL